MKNSTNRLANELDGKQWLRNSVSVWNDIELKPEESYPIVPLSIARRLIETFLPPDGRAILDPFSDSGATLAAAKELGKDGVEVVPAHLLREFVDSETVDLCVTAAPRWNGLKPRRMADGKSTFPYETVDDEFAVFSEYDEFLTALVGVFADVLTALKQGAYCCCVVEDLRKGNLFFPLHSDLASQLINVGFVYDDLLIWDRRSEYNNLRPLGYPSVFRINRMHQFILIMQKPRA